MNKNKLWVWSKIFSVLFTSVSTINVFHDALSSSTSLQETFVNDSLRGIVVWVSTLVAVGLIDIMFVALTYILEDEYDEQYNARWSAVIGLVLLLIFIFIIGFQDEGLLSFAPRVTLLVLALVSIMNYIIQWNQYREETWNERFARRKERMERKDALKLQRKIRIEKDKARRKAIKNLHAGLVNEYATQFANQLFTQSGGAESMIIDQSEIKQLHVGNESIDHEMVYETEGGYGWECPVCGEVQEATATGSPMTLRGAKIQATKHYNEHM